MQDEELRSWVDRHDDYLHQLQPNRASCNATTRVSHVDDALIEHWAVRYADGTIYTGHRPPEVIQLRCEGKCRRCGTTIPAGQACYWASGHKVACLDCLRVTVDPGQMGGEPCIRGLRIPVSVIVRMVEDGVSQDTILERFPDLEPEDIDAALSYAAPDQDC